METIRIHKKDYVLKQRILEIGVGKFLFQEFPYAKDKVTVDTYFTPALWPNVKFKFIGAYPGLTEDEAKQIVNAVCLLGENDILGYDDYSDNEQIIGTALESFESLLRREGINIYNPHGDFPSRHYLNGDNTKQWQDAEFNLWRKIIILKEV